MDKRLDQSSVEDFERRESAASVSRLLWVLGRDPDLTYDPNNGWTLAQLALDCAPDLFREYKSKRAAEYTRPLQYPFLPSISFERLETGGRLNREIIRRLSDAQLEVTGLEFGSCVRTVIDKALLQSLKPCIETGVLREIDVPPEIARRFEHVRIFRSKMASSKKRSGAPEKFNYAELAREMEGIEKRFGSEAELMRYLDKNLRLSKTGNLPKGPPDRTAMKKAILRHGLAKFFQ